MSAFAAVHLRRNAPTVDNLRVMGFALALLG
jgi:hypothetical protein